MELARLQALLARLIAAPEGVAAALDDHPADARLTEWIAGDERLGPVARLDIYANAYFYRLLDALKEDYPATLAMVGAADFHNLITGYLVEYPPSAPSLFHAGLHLGSFLRGHPLSAVRPWLPDLAALERALLESFHSADAAPLDGSALAPIPEAAWPALKFGLHPSVQLLDLGWSVHETIAAFGAGSEPAPPKAGACSILVWRRRDGEAACRVLDAAEGAALHQADAGATFAEICAAFAGQASGDDLPGAINQMLARWLADGLLRGGV